MFDRSTTVERLLAHSEIFYETAGQCGNERIADSPERLAGHCVPTARAIISETLSRFHCDAKV
jgi:hypothetical protein